MIKKFPLDICIPPNRKITDLLNNGSTYNSDEIDTRVDAVAAGLLKLNFPVNSPIAVIGLCSYAAFTLNLGIYRARHCIVPINYKVSPDIVEFCIKDSGAIIVFCDKEFKHLVPSGIQCIEFNSEQYFNFLCHDDYIIPQYDENYINSIMYTSGTTGTPKGVVKTYGARLMQWFKGNETRPKPTAGDMIYLNPLPVYHLAGINNVEYDMLFSFYDTVHLILMPAFNIKKYIEAMVKYKVTHVKLVSPMMAMLLQESELLKTLDLSHVKKISLTSSLAPVKLQEEVRKYFTELVALANPYGLTETGVILDNIHPKGLPRPINSAGHPVSTARVRLDENGVLQLKSKSMLLGYHNRMDLTAASFTNDGYFITGDVFTIDDNGFYYYQGRSDDMFKSGGEKIYPTEIETVIEKHPAVALSAVVGLPDKIKGHKPYAFVSLQAGEVASPEEIKEFIISRVASYQIPRTIWILSELPRTTVGKINRLELKALASTLVDHE